MTEGPLQLRILRYTLLGPIDDARHILRRLQNNEAFQHYLRRRTLRALPLVVGILLTSLACSAAVVFLFFRAGILLVLAATIVVAPIVLIASFSVQAYVLLSWLEGRSLAKLQEHHRPRHRGPIGQWLARSYRIDMGPLPQVPWIPALVFFLVPAAMLAQVAAPLAAGVAAFQIVAAIFYARRDPVHGIDHSAARGGVEAPKSFAAAPLREVRAPKQADDLDFASPAARSGTGSWTRRLRSFVQSGFRFLRRILCARRRHFCDRSGPAVRRRTARCAGDASRRRRASARGTGVDRHETHEFSLLRQRAYKLCRSDGAHHGHDAGDRGWSRRRDGSCSCDPRVAGEARCPPHEPVALAHSARPLADWRGPVAGAPLQQVRRCSRDRALHLAEDADRRCRSGCRRRDPCRLGLEDLRPGGISQLCPPLPG